MGGLDCFQCRANYAEQDRTPPCDEPDGACHYAGIADLAGAAALDSANYEAVQLWRLWRTLGDVTWQLIDLELTSTEGRELLDKLYVLETQSAMLQRETDKEG